MSQGVAFIVKCGGFIQKSQPTVKQYFIPLTHLVLLLFFVSGCSSNVSIRLSPTADLTKYIKFYVQPLPVDGRGINRVNRDEMNNLGLKTTTGPATIIPRNIDMIVTYEDRWRWDLVMFMTSLTLNFRDVETDSIVASGQTTSGSFDGKTPSLMTREILLGIFKNYKRPPEIAAR